MTSPRFHPDILEFLPHRPPMLLVNDIVSVSASASSARVYVDQEAPFYELDGEQGLGVPAYIGLEYMGQTAALIAGYQLREGLVEPHLGFLLGTRAYKSTLDYFERDRILLVECKEKAIVGDSLATFDCSIRYEGEEAILARANLSVFRKPHTETNSN